jgi:hypothetical protein
MATGANVFYVELNGLDGSGEMAVLALFLCAPTDFHVE